MSNEFSQKNVSILYGLLNTAVTIVFTMILYLSGANMFLNPIAYLSIVISSVICVLGGLQQRKHQGGYLSFSEALKVTLLILVIGSFITTAFQYVLLNYIDVPFREALAQVTAEKTEQMMREWGAPEESIHEVVVQTLNGNNYTIKRLLLAFALVCILWFIISLIVSLIIRKIKPLFEHF